MGIQADSGGAGQGVAEHALVTTMPQSHNDEEGRRGARSSIFRKSLTKLDLTAVELGDTNYTISTNVQDPKSQVSAPVNTSRDSEPQRKSGENLDFEMEYFAAKVQEQLSRSIHSQQGEHVLVLVPDRVPTELDVTSCGKYILSSAQYAFAAKLRQNFAFGQFVILFTTAAAVCDLLALSGLFNRNVALFLTGLSMFIALPLSLLDCNMHILRLLRYNFLFWFVLLNLFCIGIGGLLVFENRRDKIIWALSFMERGTMMAVSDSNRRGRLVGWFYMLFVVYSLASMVALATGVFKANDFTFQIWEMQVSVKNRLILCVGTVSVLFFKFGLALLTNHKRFAMLKGVKMIKVPHFQANVMLSAANALSANASTHDVVQATIFKLKTSTLRLRQLKKPYHMAWSSKSKDLLKSDEDTDEAISGELRNDSIDHKHRGQAVAGLPRLSSLEPRRDETGVEIHASNAVAEQTLSESTDPSSKQGLKSKDRQSSRTLRFMRSYTSYNKNMNVQQDNNKVQQSSAKPIHEDYTRILFPEFVPQTIDIDANIARYVFGSKSEAIIRAITLSKYESLVFALTLPFAIVLPYLGLDGLVPAPTSVAALVFYMGICSPYALLFAVPILQSWVTHFDYWFLCFWVLFSMVVGALALKDAASKSLWVIWQVAAFVAMAIEALPLFYRLKAFIIFCAFLGALIIAWKTTMSPFDNFSTQEECRLGDITCLEMLSSALFNVSLFFARFTVNTILHGGNKLTMIPGVSKAWMPSSTARLYIEIATKELDETVKAIFEWRKSMQLGSKTSQASHVSIIRRALTAVAPSE